MDKKDLEDKLDEFDELLSYQNILLGEIKEVLNEIKRWPIYLCVGVLSLVVIEKLFSFLFGN